VNAHILCVGRKIPGANPSSQGFDPMKMKIPQAFKPAPAGTHSLQFCGVIDLGTHDGDYGPKRQFRVSFLVLDALMSDGRPYQVNRTLQPSTHPDANFAKMLVALLGRDLTNDEILEGIELDELIGKICIGELKHVERTGKVYANLISVMKAPKGTPEPPLAIEPVIFLMDDDGEFDEDAYFQLPQWAQDAIAASKEYQQAQQSTPAVEEEPAPGIREKLAKLEAQHKTDVKGKSKGGKAEKPKKAPKKAVRHQKSGNPVDLDDAIPF
jgi:hypothetical protein